MLSAEETEAFAEKLGKGLRGGEIIAFKGDLGAGKTTFTRGLAKGMGLEDFVFSPTFALVNEYSGGELILYHFDMYRVTNMVDLETTGFFDYLSDDCVIAIEWSENIADVLEELSDVITITLENTDKENERKLTISTKGGLKLDFIRD
ncbi:MAG: tRNA (adenosine(37)-N6)-threonylcarbamoyltransferase complex ATPase subunit type 1 TsaE [Oscillospiraceae bacterium]|nr:tRNA (adenosine(37)-N6)-threonylcarbamoyltransferase complex ATPase subunit type 1 TsaE [Oscillospiraceae bacterium]